MENYLIGICQFDEKSTGGESPRIVFGYYINGEYKTTIIPFTDLSEVEQSAFNTIKTKGESVKNS